MKLAIIGYGRMGRSIEEMALSRGHEISLRIERENTEKIINISRDQVDVAIEFTNPNVALKKYYLLS